MFKRIFRPKHKLFKNQPNTNIMLFIFVPSPTRPSQKKTEKYPKKLCVRFSRVPYFTYSSMVSSIYDQELILFKKHKVGGWILPKLVCGSSWHECLNIMTMFTLLGRILSMMFDCPMRWFHDSQYIGAPHHQKNNDDETIIHQYSSKKSKYGLSYNDIWWFIHSMASWILLIESPKY